MEKLQQTATGSWELEWETPAYPVPTEPPQMVEKAMENVGEILNLADVQHYQSPTIIYVPQSPRTPQYNSPLIPERTQETAGKVLGWTLIAALIGVLLLVVIWVLSLLAEGFGSLAIIAKSVFEIAMYGLAAFAAYHIIRNFRTGSTHDDAPDYRPTTTNNGGQQNIIINNYSGGNQQQINRY